jgi:hypothetical protein
MIRITVAMDDYKKPRFREALKAAGIKVVSAKTLIKPDGLPMLGVSLMLMDIEESEIPRVKKICDGIEAFFRMAQAQKLVEQSKFKKNGQTNFGAN